MNWWKWGFFGMLLLWLTTVATSLYSALDSGVSHDVGAEDFELKYDAQGRYLGSRYGASGTPGFE